MTDPAWASNLAAEVELRIGTERIVVFRARSVAFASRMVEQLRSEFGEDWNAAQMWARERNAELPAIVPDRATALSPDALRHIVRCLVLCDTDQMASVRARDELRQIYGDELVREAWAAAMREPSPKGPK
jgi:hypothetical protein